MNVNPGELNKVIKIVQMESRQDKDGFKSPSVPVEIRKAYAKVTRVSGTEQMKSGEELGIIKCRFLIRYNRKEVTRGMYVQYKNEFYRIQYVNNYGDANEYIELVATLGE